MIIAQQEAREELDLVVTKGRGRSGHGSGHDSNLKSRNTKLLRPGLGDGLRARPVRVDCV